MKIVLTALLITLTLSVAAQGYSFPNIGRPEAHQIEAAIDTAFAGIGRGHVAAETITGNHKELTREMLEYLKNRLAEGVKYEIINCYPLSSQLYRTMVVCNKTDTLRDIFTLDVTLLQGLATIDLPLWQDTRHWSVVKVGTIRYFYDHEFNLKAAHDFDHFNRWIAAKLGLSPDSLDFYLADNNQQIMQWLGLTYDKQGAGAYRDGFNIEKTIFAIQHNEDFSHDLVHYYVYKVRKGPRNGFAEEGVAYYWGNAYYPDAQGHMITLVQLKYVLRSYLSAHPEMDLLTPFQKNQRGLFGPVPEISMRSTLSGIIAEYVEKKYGVAGILKLLNCGAGEANYFMVTQSLAEINAANFNIRIRQLLGN